MCICLGTKLRMAIIEAAPFIILKNPNAAYNGMTSDYTEIDVTEFDGFYKDVLVYLQNRMGFIPVIMLAKPDITYDRLVTDVANGLFDTLMTTITATSERAKIVDLSLLLMPSSIRVVIRKPTGATFDLIFFLKPFSPKLWFVVFGSILYAVLVLWFLQRPIESADTNAGDRQPPPAVNDYGIMHRIRDVFYAILGRQPSLNKLSSAEQTFRYSLYILHMVLYALYGASLVSYVIKESSETMVSGIDDIKNGKVKPNRIGLVGNSSIERYYLTSISQGKKDYYPVKTSDEIFEALRNRDIDVGLWGNQSIIYHTQNVYCDLMTVGIEFGLKSYNLPMHKDWIYKDELNAAVLSLVESEELARLETKWFRPHRCDRAGAYDNVSHPFTLQQTGGLFIMFLISGVLATVVKVFSEHRLSQKIARFWKMLDNWRRNLRESLSRILQPTINRDHE